MAGNVPASEPGVVTKLSPRSVADTVTRLTDLVGAKGMQLFAVIDLPLKVLVWADTGQTMVSYYAPAELAARHQLSAELAGNLAGIDALTDALIAP